MKRVVGHKKSRSPGFVPSSLIWQNALHIIGNRGLVFKNEIGTAVLDEMMKLQILVMMRITTSMEWEMPWPFNLR